MKSSYDPFEDYNLYYSGLLVVMLHGGFDSFLIDILTSSLALLLLNFLTCYGNNFSHPLFLF